MHMLAEDFSSREYSRFQPSVLLFPDFDETVEPKYGLSNPSYLPTFPLSLKMMKKTKEGYPKSIWYMNLTINKNDPNVFY